MNDAYNCESGENTERAIGEMTDSINKAKDDANAIIEENIKYEEEHRLKEGDLFEPIADRELFNCYAYAIGVTTSFLYPLYWEGSYKPPPSYSVDTLLMHFLLGHAGEEWQTGEAKPLASQDSTIEDGWYRIAMRLAFDYNGVPYDYHFWKQDPKTGEWWNKHGSGKIQYLGKINPDNTNNCGWTLGTKIYSSETRYVAFKEKFWSINP